MRVRQVIYPLLTLVIASLGAWGWIKERRAEQQIRGFEFLARRAEFLQTENARLAAVLEDKRRAEETANDRRERDALQQTVAGLSGLKFLRPVVFREIPRADLPVILSQKLSQQVPDREFGNLGLELSALGLIPEKMDLKKVYLDLLGEQIGAFYDQHTHELFTFSEHPLSNAQNRVIMAHELTHALQDQHFNLLKLPLEAKGNDDRALAATALVEGDATVVMNQYLLSNLSAAALRDSLTGALTSDVRQLASAPRYLRESLLFPYLQGQIFVAAISGGRDAVASAFHDPPSSTAQILHPERYLAQPREQPILVQMPATAAWGQEPVMDNVLGEFTLRQVLELWLKDKAGATRLAGAWRGDRVLIYGDQAVHHCVCRTVWRDASAAREYCQAAMAGLTRRYAKTPPASAAAATPGDNAPAPTDSEYATYSLAAGGHELRIIQTGAQTLLIDARDTRWADELTRLFSPLRAAP